MNANTVDYKAVGILINCIAKQLSVSGRCDLSSLRAETGYSDKVICIISEALKHEGLIDGIIDHDNLYMMCICVNYSMTIKGYQFIESLKDNKLSSKVPEYITEQGITLALSSIVSLIQLCFLS